jgi:hypothetical protein
MLIFNDHGLLAAQDYPMTLDQLHTSVLVTGPKDVSPWDTNKRMTLVNNYIRTLANHQESSMTMVLNRFFRRHLEKHAIHLNQKEL